ncbi:MAG: hypothetical protein A2147_02375 [Chloroflexi bacterium RBG_16_57_8]|nr:MAG: hypothetical protein A2147_02375 [Chloroflexi bacterium RBG_16_57_8]
MTEDYLVDLGQVDTQDIYVVVDRGGLTGVKEDRGAISLDQSAQSQFSLNSPGASGVLAQGSDSDFHPFLPCANYR